jgi:hypothetical protein
VSGACLSDFAIVPIIIGIAAHSSLQTANQISIPSISF